MSIVQMPQVLEGLQSFLRGFRMPEAAIFFFRFLERRYGDCALVDPPRT
ncbi:MAG: hypothetical protein JJ896_07050 [Rhodothermales bacterium]|nr:hypothetical protein [Rhodothermales bacterium]MBO6779395.1 hypothetical protein [Rhodothermales bacterium]